ncbi:MAG: TonB-dependent receptor [Bacteroidetes bacterium]|nr:TonB-dependent receptor [Bacteroidota bacterium]
MIKRLFFFLFFSLLVACVYAKNDDGTGSIAGKISTSDGQPAADVTVKLLGTKRGTITDENGRFTLEKVTAGEHQLQISLTGHETKTYNVTVELGKTAVLAIELTLSKQQLQEVVVTGGRNKFGRKESNYIARMPLSNMENPQVYNVVTSDLLEEQVATNFKNGFKNFTGVSSNGANHSANGRFYTTLRGFNTSNAVRNGLVSSSVSEIDPVNIERMEAIKGPAGTLFGASLASFGGVFNRVTKRAMENFRGEVAYSTGSFGLNRVTLDLNTPLNDDHTSLMRVNAAANTERSFQDFGYAKTFTVAPSFTFKPNDRITVYIDGEFYKRKGTNAYGISFPGGNKVTATSADQLKLDYDKSYTNNSILATTDSYNFFGEVDYKISDNWKSQTVLAYTTCEFYYPALTFALYTDSTMGRNVRSQFTSQVSTQIQQNITGDFKIGNLRNRLLAGIDVQFGKYDFPDTKDFIFDTINYINPGTKLNAINIDGINNRLPSSPNVGSRSGSSSIAGYISDVLNLTNNLLIMASLRYDRFKSDGSYTYATGLTAGQLSQQALSPKLGVVYKMLNDQVSFFANYMNGFQGVSGVDYNGKTFKPQYANQAEAGVKAELFNGRLVGTASYYNISVTNATRADVQHTGFSVQDGTQKSSGVEVEVIANPVNGLNILTGYSYNDSKLTQANANVEGKRPAGSGAYTTVNGWASYRMVTGVLKGLGLAAGVNYSGEQYFSNTTTFRFTIPSFTTVDGSIFYDVAKFRIAGKVDNIGDTKYWSQFTLAPNAQRRYTVSFTARF